MRYKHLTQGQRFIIEEMISKGQSLTLIAKCLSVHRSTISRELKRNKGTKSYFGLHAHRLALGRRPHIVLYKRKVQGRLENIVTDLLYKTWSPEQISKRLLLERNIKVSHESIYRFVAMDQRCGGTLYKLLRRSRVGRRRWKRRSGLKIKFRSITERPIEANQRTEIGHWERDLICDRTRKHALLTVVDRKSRFTKIRAVENYKTDAITKHTAQAIKNYPVFTITNDNGLEFFGAKDLEKDLKAKVYFTTPYSSWERGTVENTNGLIRQFFPKGTAIECIKPWQIKATEKLLNNRPRKVLNWKTPHEVFFNQKTNLVRARLVALDC